MSIGDILSGAVSVVGDVTGISPIVNGAESLLGIGGADGSSGSSSLDGALSSALMTTMMSMSAAMGSGGAGGFSAALKKSGHSDDSDSDGDESA
ncbi:hypothetical protein R75461_05593 [Paraburkholderia nemoris]|jgi:hypothetical protein|uniref:hypothetical protein n=1 Tax=Paraburkholderia nemoris TaxID=2793076 RepID=UPI0019092F38|nr:MULTISPECIES: hypothetical protein [Paraburkholderia]MBK3784383.1 hypothetical protein [Paraburkholderia aspalathi]CAE6758661.1 hypothetical protein LMG22931_03491 [Paraburkholderia nemoris]CAE6809760.1 hypothetical protein R75461_05593 [Paraburkholderia nemoris]